MGAQVARLEAGLSLNDANFEQGIARAEKRAQTFAGRVETSFQGLFKRTPGRRAERALTGFIGDLSSGNLTTAIAGIAGKMTGLGLAVGVGVGASVELFQHFKASIDETTKASDLLHQQMNKPLALTSIEGLGKALENLNEKQGTTTHAITNFLKDVFTRPLVTDSKGTLGYNLGQTQIEEQRETQDAIDKRHAAEKLRGFNENVRANTLAGIEDPQRRALAEMRFKFEDRRKALQANPDKGSELRLKALDVEQDVAEKAFKVNKKAGDVRLEVEEKIVALAMKGLSISDQKKLRAVSELKTLNDQIDAEKDPFRKRQLTLERDQKKMELRGFGNPAATEIGGPEWGSIAKREGEVNDPNVWGSLGASAANRGEIPMAKTNAENPEVVKAVGETNRILTEVFLK